MTKSFRLIRRIVRPRLIAALIPFVTLVTQGGRALAGLTCQDIISGNCTYMRTDTYICAVYEGFGVWKDRSCTSDEYCNRTYGWNFFTGRTNCGTQYWSDDQGWTYSCANGQGW